MQDSVVDMDIVIMDNVNVKLDTEDKIAIKGIVLENVMVMESVMLKVLLVFVRKYIFQ